MKICHNCNFKDQDEFIDTCDKCGVHNCRGRLCAKSKIRKCIICKKSMCPFHWQGGFGIAFLNFFEAFGAPKDFDNKWNHTEVCQNCGTK